MGGDEFYSQDYHSLGCGAEMTVIVSGGVPFFSILSPVMLLLHHYPRSLNLLIDISSWLDRRPDWFGGSSLPR